MFHCYHTLFPSCSVYWRRRDSGWHKNIDGLISESSCKGIRVGLKRQLLVTSGFISLEFFGWLGNIWNVFLRECFVFKELPSLSAMKLPMTFRSCSLLVWVVDGVQFDLWLQHIEFLLGVSFGVEWHFINNIQRQKPLIKHTFTALLITSPLRIDIFFVQSLCYETIFTKSKQRYDWCYIHSYSDI